MKVICYGVGPGDAIASKNCLYLSTSSTSRFLNETGGAFAGQWSEQENANLAKITTKICCKEQSLWEGGLHFTVCFLPLFVRPHFTLQGNTQKLESFLFIIRWADGRRWPCR